MAGSIGLLRDGAAKSHQRVHKSPIQIAAAAAVKALYYYIFYFRNKKREGALRINQSSYPSDTLLYTFNNAYYIQHFPPPGS